MFLILHHKFAGMAVIAAALAAVLLIVHSGKFTNDISCMLPEDSEAAAAAGHTDVFSLAELIPPQKKRNENLLAWKNFDLASYGSSLRKAGIKAGFPEDYFDDAVRNIENARQQASLAGEPAWLSNIKRRLLVKGTNGFSYTLLMYNENSGAEEFLKNADNCSVISRSQLPVVMARDIMRALLPSAVLAILLVLVICGICFRSIKKVFLVMLPVVYSLLCCLGFYALIGKGINIPVMAAAAILCGIGVDYGILVLHSLENKRQGSVLHSITVSAVTTFAGGLTVAFARHPMLHDAGITLMIGIVIVWAAAVFLLPVLFNARR